LRDLDGWGIRLRRMLSPEVFPVPELAHREQQPALVPSQFVKISLASKWSIVYKMNRDSE
jgi:hypothetical protein